MSEVYVYVYDISKGFARINSLLLLGKQIDGIWHTGIVIFAKEIYFGSNGIETCQPEGTILGPPDKKILVGITCKTTDDLSTHIAELSMDKFNGSKYDLLKYNCNTFSNYLATWLTGTGIPPYIINLPTDFLTTPLGQFIEPLLSNYSPVVSAICHEVITYKNNTETTLTPIYFTESMSFYVTEFSLQSFSLLNDNHRQLLLSLINPTTNQDLPTRINDLHDILRLSLASDSVDDRTKHVILDVLRYKVINDRNLLLLLIDLMHESIELFVHISNNTELESLKCKLVSNIVGVLSDDEITKDALITISNYALELFQSRTNDDVASSLIRNIILHNQNLDFNTVITVASALIYLVSVHNVFSAKTEENVIGSIYFLVIKYEEIKDLAKSHDLFQSIRNKTKFCRRLSKELQ